MKMNWKVDWKTLLLLPVFALVVMGQACQEQDTQVRSVLNTACPAVNVAYEHYVAVKDAVSVKTQNRVELVKAQFDRLCANPETATTVSVLASASAAFLAVRAAIAEGRGATSATYNVHYEDYAAHFNALEDMTNRAEKALNDFNAFNANRR